MTEIIGIIISN